MKHVFLSFLAVGGLCVGLTGGAQLSEASEELEFATPALTGEDAIIIPPSGKVRRDIQIKQPDGNEILYKLEKPIAGVHLEEDLLIVDSSVEKSQTFTIFAYEEKNGKKSALPVEIKKIPTLKDFPANPLTREGYQLYHASEFDSDELDPSKWSPYYLRSWTTNNQAKSHYFFEDGSLNLNAPRNIADAWSAQDNYHRVSSISSFERQYLHRFGSASESREIPVYEGITAKYGYFETRLKMPNTRDGSHFAWWMVGTQDDQNRIPSLATDPSKLFPSNNLGWGVEDYYWTNQGAEYDIIEQHLDPYKSSKENYESWLPVIHKNGTRDYPNRWYAGSDVPSNERVRYPERKADPRNEYHIYGLEWTPEGTKFYFDNELVYESNHSAGYHMMSLFSVYAGRSKQQAGDYGYDRGIYPKNAQIDYFRIYKKNGQETPNSVVLDDKEAIEVPLLGKKVVQMDAKILNQFEQEFQLTEQQKLKWCFSEDIGGVKGRKNNLDRVAIDEATGVITVEAGASLTQDLFVTAYVEGEGVEAARRVYGVKHIKLSKESSKPIKVKFTPTAQTISAGQSLQLSAETVDQYGEKMEDNMNYYLAEDIAGKKIDNSENVSITENGLLTVSRECPSGTTIIVVGDSGYRSKLEGEYLQSDDAIQKVIVLKVE
ncbi:glycoside hydrolase family 16 protein [Enterococcus gilvus]|uniref:glycoside hydrolase family 16 protein n=1 Tax=Enterococcus gilvus TaxID=160453 RepID=UPI002911CD74|nr:glycoside hydrolase family 16 protein [Enterococcus gilvus]MDU5510856.1 glycoside hydrolase family 16 protein [Enterococcus gilvus]